MSAPDFIPPEVRARLKGLRLRARHGSMALGFGQQNSRGLGGGLEFAQYRGYEPGDEPRRIDWKLYARSDRYFVREAERDSPLTVWVAIDTSGSMAQGDRARPGYARLDAARGLAACVFELALGQGDRFGLIAVGGDGPRAVEIGAGTRQRDRCLVELAGLRAHGHWPEPARLRGVWQRIPAGALVLVLSDGFDPACVDLSERLASAGRELRHIGILTAEERDFPFRGGIRFRDPETGAELLGDGESQRAGFLARFGAARRELAARLAAAGVVHVDHHLDRPLDAPLRYLFADAARRGTAAR